MLDSCYDDSNFDMMVDDRVRSKICNDDDEIDLIPPNSPLGVYTGSSARGTWTIDVDAFVGTIDLKEYSLELCILPNPDILSVSPQKNQHVCQLHQKQCC